MTTTVNLCCVAGLTYAELGYPVFPCAPGTKNPLTEHGFKDASTDPEVIAAWWEKWPNANVAIPTAGLVVIDRDGKDWLTDEPQKQFDLAAAPMSITPRGGTHSIFRQPPGKAYQCSVGLIAPKVDVRADGGYIVVPSSVINGVAYRWVESNALAVQAERLPLPPDWLIGELDRVEARRAKEARRPLAAPSSSEILESMRNQTLTSLAGTMRRRGMSRSEIGAALVVTNRERCRPPLPEAEVSKIVDSVSRYEPQRNPGGTGEDDGAQEGPVRLGDCDPESGKLVLSPRCTLPTAEALARELYTRGGDRTLHSYAGVLVEWADNHYRDVEDESIRQRLQPWLHRALRYVFDRKTGGVKLAPFESNPTTVNAALQSVRAHTHIPTTTTMPCWLGKQEGDLPASEILPCKTNNLHIPTRRIIPATPRFFSPNALEFDYDPDPEPPREWSGFLTQLFGDDGQSIDVLQEWFGYSLIADTSQQKMLLLVGPRRSGKGTIARVLTKLAGPSNVAAPTTGSLAGTFGLQPLIGRTLAIVSDARFTGPGVPVVVERLLCISGEDMITIDRKHIGSVTMKLPTRFIFLTNELPRFGDASSALPGRFVVIRLSQSFYNREDHGLTDKLCAELPGILHWSLQGLDRLRDRGRFVQPASAADAVEELEELSSPVGAFVRDCCTPGPQFRATLEDLYRAWIVWCERNGREKYSGTTASFGRDLAAAVPIKRRRGTRNEYFYEGIMLGEPSPR